MKFFVRFSSSVLIVFTIYIVSVFVFPIQADNLANSIWIIWFNNYLRDFKTWSDTIADDLFQKTTMDQINKARDVVRQTNDQINTKVEQANKVYENSKKVLDTTEELKNSIEELAALSASWDTSWSGDTNTESWIIISSGSTVIKNKTNNTKLKSTPSNID